MKSPPAKGDGLAKRGWLGTITEVLRTHSAEKGFHHSNYSLIGLKLTGNDIAQLPLFDFFRRCRNRIIHQDGTAGSDLVEFSKIKGLQTAFKFTHPLSSKNGLTPAAGKPIAYIGRSVSVSI